MWVEFVLSYLNTIMDKNVLQQRCINTCQSWFKLCVMSFKQRRMMRGSLSYPCLEYLWVRGICPTYSKYSPSFIDFSTIQIKWLSSFFFTNNITSAGSISKGAPTFVSYDSDCTSWALSNREWVRVVHSYPHSEYLWVQDEWLSCSSYSPLFIDLSAI